MGQKEGQMAVAEKLRREIETLKESVRLVIEEKSKGMPGAGRTLAWCFEELKQLGEKLKREIGE